MDLPAALQSAAEGKIRKTVPWKGAIRVAAYGSALLLAFTGYSVHSARASVVKAAFQLGEQLRPFTEEANLGEGDVARLSLNGEIMSIAHSQTDRSVVEVLDLFENECDKNPSAMAGEWAKLPTARAAASAFSMKKVGTLRSHQDDKGIVICLVKGSHSREGISEALTDFRRTMDLGAIGKLRYVSVQKLPSGRTQVISAWTEDTFAFGNLFRTDGSDLPGNDIPGVPRLPGSQRLLDAKVVGTSFALHSYRAKQDPAASLSFYSDFFHSNGWTEIESQLPGGAMGSTFTKNHVGIFVSAQPDEKTGTTLVGLGEMGNPTSTNPLR